MTSPTALIFIAKECPHCPSLLKLCTEAVKDGELSQLEVVNIATQGERASKLGIRSVPWVRIGDYEHTGVATPSEFAAWIKKAAKTDVHDHIVHMLENQQLEKCEKLSIESHDYRSALVPLFSDLETPMAVRIGIGAVMEALADADKINELLPLLSNATQHKDEQVRADACHYLGLTSSESVVPILTRCLEDPSHEVSEIAAESLEAIDGAKQT